MDRYLTTSSVVLANLREPTHLWALLCNSPYLGFVFLHCVFLTQWGHSSCWHFHRKVLPSSACVNVSGLVAGPKQIFVVKSALLEKWSYFLSFPLHGILQQFPWKEKKKKKHKWSWAVVALSVCAGSRVRLVKRELEKWSLFQPDVPQIVSYYYFHSQVSDYPWDGRCLMGLVSHGRFPVSRCRSPLPVFLWGLTFLWIREALRVCCVGMH